VNTSPVSGPSTLFRPSKRSRPFSRDREKRLPPLASPRLQARQGRLPPVSYLPSGCIECPPDKLQTRKTSNGRATILVVSLLPSTRSPLPPSLTEQSYRVAGYAPLAVLHWFPFRPTLMFLIFPSRSGGFYSYFLRCSPKPSSPVLFEAPHRATKFTALRMVPLLRFHVKVFSLSPVPSTIIRISFRFGPRRRKVRSPLEVLCSLFT